MIICEIQLLYYCNCSAHSLEDRYSRVIFIQILFNNHTTITHNRTMLAFILVKFNSITAITVCQLVGRNAKLRREFYRCIFVYLDIGDFQEEALVYQPSANTVSKSARKY